MPLRFYFWNLLWFFFFLSFFLFLIFFFYFVGEEKPKKFPSGWIFTFFYTDTVYAVYSVQCMLYIVYCTAMLYECECEWCSACRKMYKEKKKLNKTTTKKFCNNEKNFLPQQDVVEATKNKTSKQPSSRKQPTYLYIQPKNL